MKQKKIKLYFYDENGNEVGSKKYRIKIDGEDPEFTDLPSVLHKKVGDKVWWKAEDNEKIDRYRYTIYGRVKYTKQDHFYVPDFVSRGLHGVDITAYDKAGNKNTKHILIWVW